MSWFMGWQGGGGGVRANRWMDILYGRLDGLIDAFSGIIR